MDIYNESEKDVKISSGIQRMISGNAVEDVIAVKKTFEVKAITDGDIKGFIGSTLILSIDDKRYSVLFDGQVSKTRINDNLWDISFRLVEV